MRSRNPGSLARVCVASMASAVIAMALVAGVGAQAPVGPIVNVWITTADGRQRLSPQPATQFTADAGSNPLTIDVDPATVFQPIDGVGASFTDSSAWLVTQVLAPGARAQLMTQLFDRTVGIGLSYLRQPIGATDFALSNYTFDDMPDGQTDPGLARFSIDHDRAYILPLLQQALQINPQLRVMLTPWSAPAWMKSSQALVGGRLNDGAMAAYAAYLVKSVQAYQAAGVPIHRLTVQNEPHFEPPGYPGMRMEWDQQASLIDDYLAPAMERAGLATQVAAWDHNWVEPAYPMNVLGDPDAYEHVSGVAWHCYDGAPEAMTAVHGSYPLKDVYLTECSAGGWRTGFGANLKWDMEHVIIGGTRNWARMITKWNVALDTNHGPQNGGCPNCTGLVTIDQASGSIAMNFDYYALGHMSKFVVPGARRVASNTFGTGSIEDVAFVNPDGSRVAIVLNADTVARTFKLREGARSVSYTLPAGSAATFTWAGGDAAPGEEGGGAPPGGTPGAPPSAWIDGDVGAAGSAGRVTWVNGTFTVAGAGSDVWGSADAFNYVYQPLVGDGQIVAHVVSVENTNPFAKAGVMIRQTTSANSAHVTLDAKPGGGLELLTRSSAGAETSYLGGNGARAPVWLKLARAGSTVSAYSSADGSSWTPVGTTSVSMAGTVLVGLAVCSHDSSVLNTSVFDNVSVEEAAADPATPTSEAPRADVDVGAVGAEGSAALANGVYTVKGAGADVWGAVDSFNFAYTTLTGDGEVVARVASVENTDAYAKAGVMIRDGLSPSAANVLLSVKPAGGSELLVRRASGGSTEYTGGAGNATPVWTRLTRAGATVTASLSNDGIAWSVVGSASVSLPSTVYVGLAVCSHRAGTLNTATFDHVSTSATGGGAPSPVVYTDGDVGWTGIAGTATDSTGTYTIKGAGADIWGNADSFTFASLPLDGDGEVVARLLSMQDTHVYAKAGLMIRESRSTDSPNVMIDLTPSGGVEFMSRAASGASTTYVAGTSARAPVWLKLVRTGSTIAGYVSSDGRTWSAVGTTTAGMASHVSAGLVVCSHDTGALNTATFDNWSVR